MSAVCPHCGSEDTQRRGGRSASSQVCRACGTRFTRPASIGERLLFAAVFFVPGLVFVILSLVMTRLLLENPNPTLGTLGVGFGILAGLCFLQGIRELAGRAKKMVEESDVDSSSEFIEAHRRAFAPSSPSLVPKEESEQLVREIAEKHKVRGILRKLGAFRRDHLANAAASFAQEMEDGELPLTFLDNSFWQNGKSGFLLTNRALYSSFLDHPIGLGDIKDVTYEQPTSTDFTLINVLTLMLIFLHVLPSSCLRFLGQAVLVFFILMTVRSLTHRLLVNGKVVYKKRLRGAFWIELLKALAAAAREIQPFSMPSGRSSVAPSVVVLETTLSPPEGAAIETRRIDNPSWQQVERSIRELNQDSHPSVRIWAGEVEQAPALEILGGNGKYALRELGEDWVYYDPSGDEHEVEVCLSGAGYRCPAFYVCTDLNRVLEIARHFVDTGTPE